MCYYGPGVCKYKLEWADWKNQWKGFSNFHVGLVLRELGHPANWMLSFCHFCSERHQNAKPWMQNALLAETLFYFPHVRGLKYEICPVQLPLESFKFNSGFLICQKLEYTKPCNSHYMKAKKFNKGPSEKNIFTTLIYLFSCLLTLFPIRMKDWLDKGVYLSC